MFVFSRLIFQSLTDVATLVARSLYLQAGGKKSELNNITADPKTVSHMTREHAHTHDLMCSTKVDSLFVSLFFSLCLSQVAQLLYGFLVQKNNSWFRSLLPPEVTKKDSSLLGQCFWWSHCSSFEWRKYFNPLLLTHIYITCEVIPDQFTSVWINFRIRGVQKSRNQTQRFSFYPCCFKKQQTSST